LTEDAKGSDPAVVTGMEAHIVSGKSGGPRYRPLPSEEVDDPDNLILLCPNDHARVDKQDSAYSEEELRRIKSEHELWVRRLGSHVPQVRLRDPDAGKPMLVHRMATGTQLMAAAGGSHAMRTSQPERLEADEVELLADFLQNVSDWSELWNGLGPGERLRAEYELTQDLDDLLEKGFLVYAGVRRQVLEGGMGPPANWWLVIIVVVRSGDGEISDERIAFPLS
jgi:hypothetical protein